MERKADSHIRLHLADDLRCKLPAVRQSALQAAAENIPPIRPTTERC